MKDDEAAARLHRLDGRLYQGGRPSRLARAVNRVWVALVAIGVPRPGRMATLRVPGRRTGRPVTFPLVVADLHGERFLVAMLGQDTNWVRNVRAAGGRAVLRHRRAEAVLLEEVDAGSRAPVLRRYLALSPGGRTHIPVGQDAPVAEFERIADRYPVFRVTPDPGR